MAFLRGTYVSIKRDASKLHDVRHGITDEFRHCVEQTSLFMSVCSIICAFCTLIYSIILHVLLIVKDLLSKFYTSITFSSLPPIQFNSIQFISTPFFGIRFKLVIEETQFETTWQVTKLNGTRQLNLPNVPSVGPSRTLFHHIRADERMPKKRTRLFYKAKPDPPLLKEKQR